MLYGTHLHMKRKHIEIAAAILSSLAATVSSALVFNDEPDDEPDDEESEDEWTDGNLTMRGLAANARSAQSEINELKRELGDQIQSSHDRDKRRCEQQNSHSRTIDSLTQRQDLLSERMEGIEENDEDARTTMGLCVDNIKACTDMCNDMTRVLSESSPPDAFLATVAKRLDKLERMLKNLACSED